VGGTAAGEHAAAGRAATARDPKRIVPGAAAGVPAKTWLSPGHGRDKTLTNCVTNRWGDDPDTPRGVRGRVARENDPALERLFARLDDETIAMAIGGVRDLEQRWIAVRPGGTLRLSRPLSRDSFTAEARNRPAVQ
jgi:hypothetical protein